jgi:hypothetical protein
MVSTQQKKSLIISISSSKAANPSTDDAMATGKKTTSRLASFIYVLVPSN